MPTLAPGYDYSLTDLLSAIPAKTLTTERNSRQNSHDRVSTGLSPCTVACRMNGRS
jgi:hypothetical protein